MIPVWEMIVRLALAIVLGGLIGLEREFHEQRAGVRTNALVSLGSALFTLISAYGFLHMLTLNHVQIDPTRIASYIVAGIGFLGAGTIVIRKTGSRGLTTAAAVWIVAAVGMACGIGFYWEALAATALALVVLHVLGLLEQRLMPAQAQATLQVSLETGQASGELMGQIYEICVKRGLVVETIQAQHQKGESSLVINSALAHTADALQALEEIQALPGVRDGSLDLQDLLKLRSNMPWPWKKGG